MPAADAFDVVVVALLREADLGLEAEHLLAVLAERAVHQVLPDQHFAQAVEEGVDDQRMGAEIGRGEDLELRDARLRLVGRGVDALHEHAGEEEVREDDDAAIAELCRMLERRASPAGR